jgi:peptidoglycan/LPS O-acetylase OafA/YrhL
MAEQTSHPTYRPDIDGLRAIAVLSVVGYHAFPSLVRGGFIGVDIFFVISGFLISTIIIQNIKRGTFSLFDFYSRRVKRIFPALTAVLFAVLIFGWFTLFPEEYKQLGKHIGAGAGFISNYVLWRESDYFDVSAEIKPLLHLWSLGVEEQFYILWPVLIWVLWKLRVNLLAVTLVIALGSFAFNIYDLKIDPSAVFYLPQARFWELLIGSTLAYISLHRNFPTGVAVSNGLSVLGSVMILLGIVCITKDRAFPGWFAILPTVGAALIISAGHNAWPNRKIYSNRILVWVGLISFPLYLWHWPILAFARIFNGETPPRSIRIAALILAIILAWITYEFIEKPIRFSRKAHAQELRDRRPTSRVVMNLCICMACLGIFGLTVFNYDGFSFRNQKASLQLEELPWDAQFRDLAQTTFACLPLSIRNKAYVYKDGTVRCRQTIANTTDQTVALIGDSHAEHLFYGLSKVISPRQNLVYFTYSCLPFVGLNRLGLTDCEKMQDALEYIVKQPSIKTVILSAFWEDRMVESDIRSRTNPDNTDRSKIFSEALSNTIQQLNRAGKSVVFAYDVPTLDFEPTNCIRPRIAGGGKCSTLRKTALDNQHSYRAIAAQALAANPTMKSWDPLNYFCDDVKCNVMAGGSFLYRDRSHVTSTGSEFLAKSLIKYIAQ